MYQRTRKIDFGAAGNVCLVYEWEPLLGKTVARSFFIETKDFMEAEKEAKVILGHEDFQIVLVAEKGAQLDLYQDTERDPLAELWMTGHVGNKKINAIKVVRELTGLGLKEAAELVHSGRTFLLRTGRKSLLDRDVLEYSDCAVLEIRDKK